MDASMHMIRWWADRKFANSKPSELRTNETTKARGEAGLRRMFERAKSSRSHPRRGGMSRHLEPLAGVRDVAAINLQDREVLRQVVADKEVLAVGREHCGLGQATDLDVPGLGHFLPVDF